MFDRGGFGGMGLGPRTYSIDFTLLLGTQVKGEFRVLNIKSTFPMSSSSGLGGILAVYLAVEEGGYVGEEASR